MTISTPLVTLQVLATLHNTIALNTATNNKAASTYVNCDCQCSSLTFQVCLFVSFFRSSLRYRGIENHPTGQIWPNPGKLQIVSTRVGKWLKILSNMNRNRNKTKKFHLTGQTTLGHSGVMLIHDLLAWTSSAVSGSASPGTLGATRPAPPLPATAPSAMDWVQATTSKG